MMHLSAAAEGQAMASLPLFSTKKPSFTTTKPIYFEAFCKSRVLEWGTFSRTRFSGYREIRVSGCSKTRASRCCNRFYKPRVSKCSSGEMFSSSTPQLSLHVLNCTSKVGATESGSSSSPYLEAADVVEREEGMPIPGTITFRRSSTQTHYEYLTDLETLGMENFSSELSRSVALSMGIQASAKSEPSSTPAAISIDVTKEGRDLRLDGIVRTSMALNCCRCGVPVGERVFGEFSLLLTEKPVVEPTKQCIGVVLGGVGRMPDEDEDLDEMLDLDLDDKMHFPRTEKSIDISKYIRDTVHLEIPLQCLCALGCRGKCIDCGVNLNKDTCICDIDAQKEDRRAMWGPLDQLKKQLESEGEA